MPLVTTNLTVLTALKHRRVWRTKQATAMMRAVTFTHGLGAAAFRNNLQLAAIGSSSRRSISRMAARSQQQQQQQQNQPTFGEVFNTQGRIRDKPITPEDAARMRSIENATLGQTVKGGTAAKMQSAVDKANANPNVDPNSVSEEEAALPALDEVAVPGAFVETVNVDIDVTMASTPATGRVDVVDHPITIGEALEVAAENIGNKPLTETDARVIQSAESRATGNAPGVKRVVAAEAQAAAVKNATDSTEAIPTVKDVLNNATEKMPIDKVVTHEDAARVQSVEQRSKGGVVERGGIAATLRSAADKNAASDFEPRTGTAGRIPKDVDPNL